MALLDLKTEGSDLTVAGEDFEVVFDMSAGVMKSFRKGGPGSSSLRSAP
ncbi:MAG: hypothetical protein MZV63_68345 [Marinilabiliales bacterium]|nr:hypothetical protein [Marinilabiliales bacterium]